MYSGVTKSQTLLSGFHFFIDPVGTSAVHPCGSERSTGEGIGYPFQYSWPSLVAQLVKNPPAMQETLVQFLGREDPLEKG